MDYLRTSGRLLHTLSVVLCFCWAQDGCLTRSTTFGIDDPQLQVSDSQIRSELIIGQEGGVIGEHGSDLVGAGDVEGASRRRVEQSQLGLVVQPVILQLIEEDLVHLGNAFSSSSSQFEVTGVGAQG